MRTLGIWMDKEKAFLVQPEIDQMDTIVSNVETFHIQGGSGSSAKGGPQDVVQDKKYLEREKNQLREYFKKIVERMRPAEQIVIYGPAQVPTSFYKMLQTDYKQIAKSVKDVIKADSMTENQTKALIREFFASK